MHSDNDITLFRILQYNYRSRIIMTTPTTLRADIAGATPLWWFEPSTQTELNSVSVWLGEQRKLWPTWRRIAECKGRKALADEIGRLWSLEPIEDCTSMMMSRGDDPCEMALFAKLVTRRSELVRHRFSSPLHLTLFTKWHLRTLAESAPLLLFQGSLSGPEHLGRLLDEIADSEVRTYKMIARS